MQSYAKKSFSSRQVPVTISPGFHQNAYSDETDNPIHHRCNDPTARQHVWAIRYTDM